MVEVVAEEGEEDDAADDPEAIFEFEFCGSEGHVVGFRDAASS